MRKIDKWCLIVIIILGIVLICSWAWFNIKLEKQVNTVPNIVKTNDTIIVIQYIKQDEKINTDWKSDSTIVNR